MRFFWMASRVAFYGLLAMLVLAVATTFLPKWEPQFRLQPSCYWGDAMITYVECQGFPGARVLGFVLGMPWWLFVYGPMFLMQLSLSGQLPNYVAQAPAFFAIMVGFAVWLILGLLYPLRWAYLKLRARLSVPEED